MIPKLSLNFSQFRQILVCIISKLYLNLPGVKLYCVEILSRLADFHQWSWQYVYARMCVRINEHTICRMWTYVLNYTYKYVQYTYNIRLRSYCIRTRRIWYVHVRIRSYTHVYARIWLQGSRMLVWLEPYVNVFPMNTCRYWHPAEDTDWTYMKVYVRICSEIRTYTCSTYMYVFVIIRAYTYWTYMHVFLHEYPAFHVPFRHQVSCTNLHQVRMQPCQYFIPSSHHCGALKCRPDVCHRGIVIGCSQFRIHTASSFQRAILSLPCASTKTKLDRK